MTGDIIGSIRGGKVGVSRDDNSWELHTLMNGRSSISIMMRICDTCMRDIARSLEQTEMKTGGTTEKS